MPDKARDVLVQARVNLILREPFFGALALRLTLREDVTCQTAYTDGTVIGYNPHYILKHTVKEVEGILCHEVMHNACGHPWRAKVPRYYLRDPKTNEVLLIKDPSTGQLTPILDSQVNVAMDFAINPIIKASGMTLPGQALTLRSAPTAEGHLDDPQFHGKAWEEIFDLLPKTTVVAVGGGGLERGDAGCGSVRPPQGSEVEQVEREQEWVIATTQAAHIARQQGKLPAGLEQFITEFLRPKVDWRTALRKFVQERTRTDYSWQQPNRRFIGMGLYLPALYSEQVGFLAFWVDSSGSTEDDQAQFVSEVASVVDEIQPAHTLLGYCDARVYDKHVYTFEAGEVLTPDSTVIPGHGGTAFEPVFKYMEEHGIEPACLIYLTDLEGSFPTEPPPYPVLWVSTTEKVAPFGDTIRLERES